MNIRALCSTVQTGIGSFLYVGDGDTLYAVDFDATDATMSGGVYKQVFTGGDDQRRKRAKRLFVMGSGTDAQSQLVLTLDDSRSIVVNLSGPYNAQEGILFYVEFDPAVATFKVACATLQYIEGTGVQINDMRLDMTTID
jgi:hypothetical protein